MMKVLTKILFIATAVLAFAACKKPNEVPPRSQAYIREYVLPEPSLLTNEEREQINKEREEYHKL